ncbi:Gallinacin-7, partial [Pelecanus crispus]
MRILYQLLLVLLMMLQGAAGQAYIPQPEDPCILRQGICLPGICRHPLYWIGTCFNGFSCCRR